MATSLTAPIFDNWTALSYKRALGSKTTPGGTWGVPSWVGDHARRLTAYIILQSYFDNSARLFLTSTVDGARAADDHREYGDAVTLRDTILAALLGPEQTIVTDGADVDLESEDLDPDDRREAEAAIQLQEWLRSWADDHERFRLKMIETERNAVGLGDGVYTLGYSPEKGRIRLRVFDPGYYFPVLDDGNEDDYPKRVHIAWELDPDKDSQRKIRRITWELRPIVDENGNRLARRYPYAPDVDSYLECVMSDATWTIDLGKHEVDDLTEASAVYETYTDPETGEEREFRDLVLPVDFIPVLHVPNTVAISNHYGKSSLERVLQILDDLSSADTDLQSASATTGKPPIALSGVTSAAAPTWAPGDLWTLGQDGKASMIDTSNSLDALLKYVAHLLDRLDSSSRVPGALLGRVKASEVPSGIALALSFGPLKSMVDEMRLVRAEKYPILLRFLWRMSIAYGIEGTPEVWYPSQVQFGPYMPSDTAALIGQVLDLYKAKAISRKTTVRLLIALGVDIEHAEDEVEAIARTDFEGAKNLADATGSEDAAAEYLQIEVTTPPPAPTPPVGAPPIQPPVPPTEE